MSAAAQAKNIRLTPLHSLDIGDKILIEARCHSAAEGVVIKAGLKTDLATKEGSGQITLELPKYFFLCGNIAPRLAEPPRGAHGKMISNDPGKPTRSRTAFYALR